MLMRMGNVGRDELMRMKFLDTFTMSVDNVTRSSTRVLETCYRKKTDMKERRLVVICECE